MCVYIYYVYIPHRCSHSNTHWISTLNHPPSPQALTFLAIAQASLGHAVEFWSAEMETEDMWWKRLLRLKVPSKPASRYPWEVVGFFSPKKNGGTGFFSLDAKKMTWKTPSFRKKIRQSPTRDPENIFTFPTANEGVMVERCISLVAETISLHQNLWFHHIHMGI